MFQRTGERCVLGEKLSFHKRKLGYCCRNKPSYWKPMSIMSIEKCECAVEDFGW